MFGITVFAYMIAVLQRSSLGVAGVDATERFGITATALSTLAVVQLAVYAALQVPVGVLVDRVGPRVLIASGAALMVAGQITLAMSENFAGALAGRLLVGIGDAATFVSALRLLGGWFSGRQLPIATQLLGSFGQIGQILSALPLTLILHSAGWTPAYLSAAALSVVACACAVLILRNGAEPTHAHAPISWRDSAKELRRSLGRPGTQLGFWSHFVTQSSPTVFALLWGFPFLSIGLGYGAANASGLLTLLVVVGAVVGPPLGILTARFPFRRSNLVLGIVVAMAAAWTTLLIWPGTPPVEVVVILLIVIAVGGPGSMIGFDFARTFNPLRSLGAATGVVNVGGFTASFVMMLLVGLVLDLVDRGNGGAGVPAQLYSLESFRWAFLVQYLVVGFGVAMLLVARRRTRSRLRDDEGIEVAPLWVALSRAIRRRK